MEVSSSSSSAGCRRDHACDRGFCLVQHYDEDHNTLFSSRAGPKAKKHPRDQRPPRHNDELEAQEASEKQRKIVVIVFMCFVVTLVALAVLMITFSLSMSPHIDSMVRKENEELMNLNRDDSLDDLYNTSLTTPSSHA